MTEKTNNEILREFAKSTNRTIVDKETAYPKTGVGTIQKYRRSIVIPNNAEKTSFFIWFSDPYARVALSTVFCGAFIPVSSKIKGKVNIRKKSVLDKLDFLSKTKKNKIGINYFDNKVVIKGDLGVEEKKFLAHSRIQHYLLEAFDSDSLVNISLNEFNLDFVPELKNKSHISIINPQTWILEKTYIESTFRQIEKIRRVI
jgi:hypothetical protein